MAKRILIYEPSCGGHHLKCVQHLIRAFSGEGREIILASTSESFEGPQYAVLLRQYEHLFSKVIVSVGGSRNIYLRSLLHSWNILKLAKQHDCDLVFIPYLDIYFYTLGILVKLCPSAKRRLFEGIIFRGDCSYDGLAKGYRNHVKRFAMNIIIATRAFQCVLFLDELIYESFLKSVPKAHSQIILCPDPVEADHSISREAFRTRFGIPQDAHVLGVFGEISSRKGIDRLLRSFEAYRPRAKEYLLVMGKHSIAAMEQIRFCGVADNIVSIDRFVTDDEFISGMNAVDVVAAVYPQHVGSASIVIHAAAAGKPVLGCDFGWIGHVVGKYDLGVICNVLNEESLMEGVKWAFNNPKLDHQKARIFAEQNTVECFIDVVCGGSERQVQV